MIETLSIILGILGLSASILSIWFAYITYVTPIKRFKWYLKNKSGWKNISSRSENRVEFLQYTKHPEFIIVETSDSDWHTVEPWISGMARPDKNMVSYQIELKANNQTVYTENFLSLDGMRIYVPIPHITPSDIEQVGFESEEDPREFYYDDIQMLLGRVIGKFHGYAGVEDFAAKQKIKIIKR